MINAQAWLESKFPNPEAKRKVVFLEFGSKDTLPNTAHQDGSINLNIKQIKVLDLNFLTEYPRIARIAFTDCPDLEKVDLRNLPTSIYY